jgi:alpha-N-arabinofuranosidase
MMEPTTITLHSQFQIGKVDSRIFGGFLEHMGRAVYEGVYDLDCSLADQHGFRTDVLEALRRLNMTAMRYPGGNFASGYHWFDGVGPREKRPTVRELAWQSIEPNQFGTDEYIRLCRKMNWVPMLTVNLGTGTPEEARNWVEYCNCPPGTKYADLRAANGSLEPHGVKLWCLGNEMDGLWQLGHVPADQYAIRAQQAAKMMKDVDRSIELVVCGSCGIGMPTYMEWDRQVLEHVGDLADYVSLHRYVGNREDDTPDFLAITNSIDQQIEEMDAACRFVQAKRRSKKRAYLCFDEWNVWYKNRQMDGEGKFAPHLIEEVYNLEDALVVAGFLNSFIRHADTVKIANVAQIVNVIAPILTRGDEMLIQSIFYPFEMFSKRREGVSLQPVVSGSTYEGKTNGEVPYIDASAILADGRLHVFATNRSLDESAPVQVDLVDRAIAALESAELLTGPGAKAANSFERPNVVVSHPFVAVKIADGRAILELPPLSLAAMTFRLSD